MVGVGKPSFSRKLFIFSNYIILTAVALVCFLPMWHVLMASISDPAKVAMNTSLLFKPVGKMTTKGYELVLTNKNLIRSYLNTFFYISGSLLMGMAITILGGYVLSRRNTIWGPKISMLIVFTMLFNGGLIPYYMLVRGLGWLNSPLALIIPGSVSVYNMMVMRTGFSQVPEELVESARIDGASELTILLKIVLPLSKAVVAVIVLFYLVQQWNSWFYPMIFMSERTRYPLQLWLRELLIQQNQAVMSQSGEMTSEMEKYRELYRYAAIIISTVPILTVYPFAQKYFVKGVMLGSVKG